MVTQTEEQLMRQPFLRPMRDITEAQKFIHQWANRAFPDRVPEAALSKLVLEEIPELLAHKKKYGPVGIAGEIADCLILLLDLCEIWGVDAAQALAGKMTINLQRQWRHDPATGFYNHTVAPGAVDSEGGHCD